MVQNILAKRVKHILKHYDIIWGAILFMVKGIPIHSYKKKVSFHFDIQFFLDKHSVVFGDMPRGL